MDYQLRLVYREFSQQPGVFSVLFSGKNERWHRSYFRLSTGKWEPAGRKLPEQIQFCGVMLERKVAGSTAIVHEVPGLHVFAEGVSRFGLWTWRLMPKPETEWVNGLDPDIKFQPVADPDGKVPDSTSAFRMAVWVRLPSALYAIELGNDQMQSQADYLWLKYELESPKQGSRIRVYVVGSNTKTTPTLLEHGNDHQPVATTLAGSSPCHAQRVLGLQPASIGADLMFSWEREGSGGPRRLVLRRRFRCPAFGPDPFLLSEVSEASGREVTLVQRPADGVINLAREQPHLSYQGPPENGVWSSASWTLQASTAHYIINSNQRALTPTPNNDWGALFARGWKALMATVEPNIKSGTLALFEFPSGALSIPVAASAYSPFPLGVLASQISQGILKAHPDKLDHMVIGRPPFPSRGDAGLPGKWEIEFPALRTHRGDAVRCSLGSLQSKANSKGNWRDYATNGDAGGSPPPHTYGLELNFGVDSITSQISTPVRAGGLDLLLLGKAENTDQKNPSGAAYILRSKVDYRRGWNQFHPLEICWWGIGYSLPDVNDPDKKLPPSRKALRLPLARVIPGETDHKIEETELFSQDGGLGVAEDRPLLITLPNAAEMRQAFEKQREFTLEIDQVRGLNYSELTTLRVIREHAGPTDTAWISARLFYLDRAPFFVCLVDTNTYSNEKLSPEDKVGSEIAYWTTEGAFRGWQRRAKSGEFRLVLPAQGVGEEMEKGRKVDGYSDLETGEKAKFRFTSSTLLTLDASDLARRYHGLPWNLRMQLNSLQPNRLVGLPAKMASFEMLYGLRFTLKEVPYLRLAELLARHGYPRVRLAAGPPKFDQSEYWTEPGKNAQSTKNWTDLKEFWDKTLKLVESRLAVYELYDDRQVEFDAEGEPVGLVVEAKRGQEHLRAELRKSADLRTSLPSEKGSESRERGNRGPIIEITAEQRNKQTRALAGIPEPAETTEPAVPVDAVATAEAARAAADWWKRLVPHYEQGLAGSMAWAFESKLIYESLWADNDRPDTPAVVEGVEATVARLYFSALGGWGTQQASFADGKINVAVSVDMGRVSELRVEVIGRIGTFKNKAKLVTVFRRTVLPTRQFVAQQEELAGRAVLRKVEEWVEFIHKHRLLQEGVSAASGSLKACSCEDRILVDSRWGTDVYTKDGRGVAWKVPIRKPGADPAIYGPANVLIHFHTHNQSNAKDACGHIENLDNLWFWSAVSQEPKQVAARLTDDTDSWADLVGVDCFPPIKSDTKDEKALRYGVAAVPGGGSACTFRIGGLTQEADLSHYQPHDPALSLSEQPAVGSVTRMITVFRNSYPAEQKPEEFVTNVRDILGNAENALAFVEQITTRQPGEVITGWAGQAEDYLKDLDEPLRSKVVDAIRPVLLATDEVTRQQESLVRSLSAEFRHLSGQWKQLKTIADTMVTAARGKALTTVQDLEQAINGVYLTLRQTADGGAAAMRTALEEQVQAAVATGRALRSAVVEEAKSPLLQKFRAVLSSLLQAPEAEPQMQAAIRRMRELAARELRGEKQKKEVFITAWRQIADDILVHAAVTALAKLDVKQADYHTKAAALLKNVTPQAMDEVLNSLVAELPTLAGVAGTPAYNKEKLAMLYRHLRPAMVAATTLAKGIGEELVKISGLMATKSEQFSKLEDALVVKHKDLEQRVFNLVEIASNNADDVIKGLESLCKEHVNAMKDRVEAIASKLTVALVEESVLLSQARETLKRNGDYSQEVEAKIKEKLKGVGEKAQNWVNEQRSKAEDAWKELQGKLQKEEVSALGKLSELAGKIPEPAELCKKVRERVSSNINHALQQGSGVLRGMAADVSKVLRQPLVRIEGLLPENPSEAIDIRKKLASIHADLTKGAAAIFDGASALWGQSERTAQGTVAQALALLEEAEKHVGQLAKRIDELEFPAMEGVVTDAAIKIARHKVEAIKVKTDRLEHLCHLPWFRSLPNKIESMVLRRGLQEFDLIISQFSEKDLLWKLEEWQCRMFLTFAYVTEQIQGARLKCAELECVIYGQLREGNTGLFSLKEDLQKHIKVLMDKMQASVGTPYAEARVAVLKLKGEVIQKLDDLEEKIEGSVKNEASAIANAVTSPLQSGNCHALKDLLELNPKDIVKRIGESLKNLPDLKFLERGRGEVEAWLNQQREYFGSTVGRLGALKDDVAEGLVGLGKSAPATLFRSFGKVPAVSGLDFTGMATFAKGVQGEAATHLSNFASRFRSVGFEFQSAVAGAKDELLVKMTPVKAMVDRTRNALGEAAQEARMKAASLEMMVSDVRRRLETDVEQMKQGAKDFGRAALKDILPDFGGIKLEKLLGAAGVSDDFLARLKQCSKISHGVDKTSLSAWVDSKVEGLVIGESLSLFSFGPVALNMKQATLDSHIRIQTNTKGETEKLGDGQILADWEVSMAGQPLITYQQAKLECKNGKVRMELDPKKVRMPSMLQMLADMMSSFSYKDDAGLMVGLRPNLPTEVTGFVTFNMDFPPMGGGTTSLQNLRLCLLFELSLAFPRFPSLTDSHLRISAGAGLSDSESPFILGIFILGGCGWFQMRLDYVVPFKDGKPYLAVKINVAIGLSASLCINLGFASGQVYIALAVEIECYIAKGKSNNRFSIVLTIAGVLDILGGLISVYLVISLSISYASGQPMRGRGRVCLTIRICWCVKIKVDKSFEYTFGKGIGGKKTTVVKERAHRLMAASPDRQPVPFGTSTTSRQPEPVPVTAPADYHRKARRMVL